MATKSPNQRSGLPSVSELLDNPSIRALAERWNRNVVVTGVRSFLDELRQDLSRRGSEMAWPPLREMAERAARHIVASQHSAERPAINATGRIWGPPWVGRPQSDAAIERAFTAGREFVAGPTQLPGPAEGDVPALLCRITGAAAAVAVHSYAGAFWLALSALAAGREVIASRGELGDVEFDCPLAELVESAGAVLSDVGAIHRTTAADYESAVGTKTAALLRLHPEHFCVIGDTEFTELEELVALARDRELVLIDALGTAPLAELSSDVPCDRRSLRSSLAAGVQLALVRGDGLAGGPQCGILVGDRALIERITAHPMFAAWKLDSPRTAALAAALEWHADRSRGESAPPLIACLTTPLENLRNRAERLAPQLTSAAGIQSAEVVSLVSHCDGVPRPDRGLASFGVALTPDSGDAAALVRRLALAAQPVIGRVEGNRLMLDLRTVLPRHDQSIVRAIAGDLQSPPVENATSGVGGA